MQSGLLDAEQLGPGGREEGTVRAVQPGERDRGAGDTAGYRPWGPGALGRPQEEVNVTGA